MSPVERRQKMLDYLCPNRQSTYDNLASAFGVSKRTVRYDIEQLTLAYPIDTVAGRYGGGISVPFWFRNQERYMNRQQRELLERMGSNLSGRDLETMRTILRDFAPVA